MVKSYRKIEEVNWVTYIECTKCHQIKELSPLNWYRDKKWLYWYSSQCKDCQSNSDKEYRQKNLDIIKLKAKEKYQRRKEQVLWRMGEYYQKNKDKISETHKRYRENNKDKIAQYRLEHREEHSEYYKKHSEKYKRQGREYRQKNKSKINEKIKKKKKETWQGAIHLKTDRKIKELWIRPDSCSICQKKDKVQAHHPDYNKWYEVIFLCPSCHQRVHNWWFECPKDKVINLLNFIH